MSEMPDWVREAAQIARYVYLFGEGEEQDLDRISSRHGYRYRYREDDDVLALYPDDWVEDGVVDPKGIDDVERGFKVNLDPDRGYDEVVERNKEVMDGFMEAVEDDRYVFNAEAFCGFLENHYLLAVGGASPAHIEEFMDEFYPRNVWNDADEDEVLLESMLELYSYLEMQEVTGYLERL